MADFTVSGLKEIERALGELPARLAKKVIRQALRAAAKPVAAAARDNAPLGETGQLRKAIKVRAGKRKKGVISVKIGVDAADFKAPGEPAADEYGTSKMAARPFMRPAFDAHGGSARDEALRLITDGIEREAAALKGK